MDIFEKTIRNLLSPLDVWINVFHQILERFQPLFFFEYFFYTSLWYHAYVAMLGGVPTDLPTLSPPGLLLFLRLSGLTCLQG